MRKAIAAVLLGFLVVGCSSGGGLMSGGAKTYTLTMNPKQGQAFSYKMTMATKGGPQATTMEANFTTTAEKIESDKITMQTQFGDMSMNGQPVPAAASAALKTPIEQVLDKHGKLISQTGGPPGMSQTAAASSNLPDHPIKVGDTWSIDFQGVKATCKLISVDNEGGKDIANIETTIAPNDKVKLDKPFTSKIDVETGMLVEADMMGMQSMGAAGAPGATVDMTIKRTN
jgi:hypothetical protein